MTQQSSTLEADRQGFTADTFAEFWAKPDLSTPSDQLHDDVVGYWPGNDEPVRGRDEYVGALQELLRGAFRT
jgi:hypothetical protein